MKKLLLLTLPLAGVLLVPAAAQAYPHCRDYSRTVIHNGFYQEERGTTCLNRWGGWDYFPRGFHSPSYVRSVQYFDSPVAYYRQPSSFFSIRIGDNDRRKRGWDRHDHRRGHGHRHHRH